MGVGQLSESDAVDALRLPFYSSSHPTGSHGWRNQFDLGNPDQEVFGIDAEELMKHLSKDLLAHGDMWKAFRELFRRGMENREGQQLPGLKDMMERLKQRQQQQLQRYNMDSVVEDLKERLENILKTERQGIDKRLQEAHEELEGAEGDERVQREGLYKLLERRAQRNLEKLDQLPPGMGGAIQELMGYDFIDPNAQRMFQELLDLLRGRMAENFSQELRQQLQGMGPQEMAGMRKMMRQLNQMLQDRLEGLEPDFESFMQQYGSLFGPNPPQSLDELLERLQSQLAQMQSLMESMSPETRRELEDLLDSALDLETQQELARFASMMEQLMPMDQLRREYPFRGDEDITLDEAMRLMGKMEEMEELERTLREAMRSGNLEDVDPEKLAELLGEEARRTWEQLQKLRKMLEEAGYIKGEDRLELTPKGIRKIGQKALKEIFLHLKKDRLGNHQQDLRGTSGDQLAETKPYEFGDPFQLDLQATVKNAILRAGPQVPVGLSPQDFEIYRNEQMTRASTVVLLDQSRSMGLFGSFQAAKKVALALFALIHSQYPRDSLYIIGFSDYAQEIKEDELAQVNWNAWVSGTNIHHALILSRKLLSKEKGGTRQILLITDGEPTAHLEGDRSYFSYPPSYRTIAETLKEAHRCTQEGILINTFMLENSYQLIDFVDKLTRINRGRVFYSNPERLGEFVLVDYVTNRRKRVAP